MARRCRDRLHLVPLAQGTVADYAATLRATLAARPIDVAFLAMAVSDFEPEPYRRQAQLRARVAGRPLPADAQGDPLGPRLVARRSTSSGSSCSRGPARRADPPGGGGLPDQPRRPDRRQRPPDAPGRAGTRSTWSAPASRPRRSSPATTWPTGWSIGCSPGPPFALRNRGPGPIEINPSSLV